MLDTYWKNTPILIVGVGGKSIGDMEYIDLNGMYYTKEYSRDKEEHYTICCSNFEELIEWVLH